MYADSVKEYIPLLWLWRFHGTVCLVMHHDRLGKNRAVRILQRNFCSLAKASLPFRRI
jgi:hypothetical protein